MVKTVAIITARVGSKKVSKKDEFMSYAAQIRYYVDPTSGDTYVTEFVPGITDEEQKTGETFNIRDYS